MNILIAADSFKGSCSAREVTDTIERAANTVLPNVTVTKIPVADGGEGTVDALVAAMNGTKVCVPVHDPLGRPITAEYGLLPDGSAVLEMRRYASFIATSNQKDLLTDPSGSRRFICIEVTGVIDTNRPIDYEQLYAQAMYELEHGERYWFDQEEEKIMVENNREFEQVPPEEQLFFRYFRAAQPEEGEWLSPAEIMEDIQKGSSIPMSVKRVNSFGRILKKQEIPSKHTRSGTLYHVVRLITR